MGDFATFVADGPAAAAIAVDGDGVVDVPLRVKKIRACIRASIDCHGRGYHELPAVRIQTSCGVKADGTQVYKKYLDIVRAPCICVGGKAWAEGPHER